MFEQIHVRFKFSFQLAALKLQNELTRQSKLAQNSWRDLMSGKKLHRASICILRAFQGQATKSLASRPTLWLKVTGRKLEAGIVAPKSKGSVSSEPSRRDDTDMLARLFLGGRGGVSIRTPYLTFGSEFRRVS
jgi:hypothetical protein